MQDDADKGGREFAPAFFGRRKGRPLRAGQARLLESVRPRLSLDLDAPAPKELTALFAPAVDEVRLEIGFGGGEHLLAQAVANPSIGFIGCEPFVNGVVKALAGIEKLGLRNIRLHFGDAALLLPWLPEGSLSRIVLLYPDPWPKRRHWKRRFVQPQRLRELARVLRRGGEFRFATDIPDYAHWTLRHARQCEDLRWTAERADDWRLPWRDFVRTRYEAKAVRQGRKPCYLTFRRFG